ncbi:nSTAND1 domain-containing NTPase [Thalassotalea agarivorans]|uniref:Tetratricopeptide repeat-containing protein n=1 Tax=Thalassotalea agarivorans TaxID=349064 RepID=A0A1I0FFQ6_THASX|nr:tetratricopeptide repeat protein [Thalassotalea agarivorans]SET57016.1 Tetratricopeptide repeat-containing protein [Thalassotalea agarivorans]
MDAKGPVSKAEKQYSFKLGAWTVDSGSNQLISNGKCYTIEPKMMDVLIYLCQHAGQTISAEQLLTACWAGTFYGDAPVQKCIAGLRKKLGCDAKNPSYIETIYRRGYKIIANVDFPDDGPDLSQRTPLKKWNDGSPYLGLNTFENKHAAVYFGRTAAIADVVHHLTLCIEKQCHFLLVLGKSGSGKSSLIRAGVLPQLSKEKGLFPLNVVKHHIVMPSQSIHESPTVTLVNALEAMSLLKESISLDKFIKEVKRSPERINAGIALPTNISTSPDSIELSSAHEKKPTTSYCLLVLDQFEQFLLDENLTTAAKEHLVLCIKQLALHEHILCVALLRNDFYAECTAIKGFTELKDAGSQYDLQPPTPTEITRMIRNPAIAAGLTFEQDAKSGVQLDDILLDTAVKNPDALPLLEYTLDQLYQKRSKDNQLTMNVYHQIGGIEGAIAKQAEKVFTSLPKKTQGCWNNIMHALIQVDHKNKHAVTARKVPITAFKTALEKQFIQRFLDAQLFVSLIQNARGEPVQYITIAHEALLKHWQRIKQWLNDNASAIQTREQLAENCAFWLESGKASDALLNSKKKVLDCIDLMDRSEITLSKAELEFIAKSKRYQSRKKYVLATAVVALIAFSISTWFQAKQVRFERDTALTQSQRTKAISKFLTKILTAESPYEAQGKDLLLEDVLANASEQLNDKNEKSTIQQLYVDALLHKTLGVIYIDLGKIKPAEYHLNKGFRIYKDNNLTRDEDYLGLLFTLSRLSVLKSDPTGEYARIIETIEVSKLLFGEEHKDTLGALDNLATYYLDQKNYDEAEAIFLDVYHRRKTLFGASHNHTLYSLENLGDLYFAQNMYSKAESYYSQCYETWLEKAQLNNPYTLHCMRRLAITQLATNQYDNAEKLFTRHIDASSRVMGTDHPEVLSSKHYLGELYIETGKSNQARLLLTETWQQRKAILGESHKNTLLTKRKLDEVISIEAGTE